MGEILGVGITHYPGFKPAKAAPVSLLRLLQDPGLDKKLLSPANWPEMMRREWADDKGAAFAEAHRQEVIAEIRIARAALDEFKPDFVLVWGDDQYENFQEDIIPPFCVLAYDSVDIQPWAKPGTPPNAWNEPSDTNFHVRGHKEGAKYLTSQLISNAFDVSYAYKPLHAPLSHAFANSVLFLDWDRRGFDFPLVPFSINCYGRRIIVSHGYMESLENPVAAKDFDPPSPSPARCFDLGAACARAIKDSPWRVAFVASSSWSHAFLTRKHSYLYPDMDSDRALFKALQKGDYDFWRSRTLADVEESGQHEILNWCCLVGAMAELKRKPDMTSFIETNVMNSNKVVATFRP
jgi:hypothetical protein